MLLTAVVGLGISFTCMSRLTAPLWHLYLLFALTPLAAAANPLGYRGVQVRRFQRRLGLALGLALIGVGLGAAILPALAQHFITKPDWRSAYLVLAASAVAVGIPAAILATCRATGPAIRLLKVVTTPIIPLIRTRAFPLICGTCFLVGTAGAEVLSHLIPMMTDHGSSAAAAAKIVGLVGISTSISRGLVGSLLDRVRAGYMVAAVAIVSAGMCLLLAHGGGLAVYCVVCSSRSRRRSRSRLHQLSSAAILRCGGVRTLVFHCVCRICLRTRRHLEWV